MVIRSTATEHGVLQIPRRRLTSVGSLPERLRGRANQVYSSVPLLDSFVGAHSVRWFTGLSTRRRSLSTSPFIYPGYGHGQRIQRKLAYSSSDTRHFFNDFCLQGNIRKTPTLDHSMSGKTFTAFHQYEPVEAPCIIFIIVFMLLLAAHLWQAARAKAWWMWPLIVATALEAIGYLTRLVHNTPCPFDRVTDVWNIIKGVLHQGSSLERTLLGQPRFA